MKKMRELFQKYNKYIFLLCVIGFVGVVSFYQKKGNEKVMVNQNDRKARDLRRKADLKTFQLALEEYFLSYGKYPLSAGVKVDLTREFNQLNEEFTKTNVSLIDPLEELDPNWPNPVYWQITDQSYAVFIMLEVSENVALKQDPLIPEQKVTVFNVDGTLYNYWVGKVFLDNVPILLSSPIPESSVITEISPSPQPSHSPPAKGLQKGVNKR